MMQVVEVAAQIVLPLLEGNSSVPSSLAKSMSFVMHWAKWCAPALECSGAGLLTEFVIEQGNRWTVSKATRRGA